MPYKDPEKRRARQRQYHQDHKEQINTHQRWYEQKVRKTEAYKKRKREYARYFRSVHKKRLNAKARENRLQHLEEARQKDRETYVRLSKIKNSRSRSYYRKHREDILKQKITYGASHLTERNIISARRKARKAGLPNTLTVEEWEKLKSVYHHRCDY